MQYIHQFTLVAAEHHAENRRIESLAEYSGVLEHRPFVRPQDGEALRDRGADGKRKRGAGPRAAVVLDVIPDELLGEERIALAAQFDVAHVELRKPLALLERALDDFADLMR